MRTIRKSDIGRQRRQCGNWPCAYHQTYLWYTGTVVHCYHQAYINPVQELTEPPKFAKWWVFLCSFSMRNATLQLCQQLWLSNFAKWSGQLIIFPQLDSVCSFGWLVCCCGSASGCALRCPEKPSCLIRSVIAASPEEPSACASVHCVCQKAHINIFEHTYTVYCTIR